MNGQITSYFDLAQNARILVDASGAQVNIAASKTHGVNEGIALAISGGWSFRCLPHEQVQCDDGINIPACANADIDLGSTEFYIKPGVAQPAFHMDSFNGGRFLHSGIIVNASANPYTAMYIAPSTPDPKYAQKIIQNAELSFGWLQCQSTVGNLCEIDLSVGMFYNNKRIEWQCLQGWDGVQSRATYGLYITNPGAGNAFNMNSLRVGQLFGFSDTGIRIGVDGTNCIYLSDNDWQVSINAVGGSITSALTTFGSYDTFNIGATIYSGDLQYPMILRPGTTGNRYLIRQATAQFPVSDSGINNKAI